MRKRSMVIALILVLALALTVPVIAATTSKEATLNYRDIKITLDGQTVTTTDANGNIVEPFIIDGTTYLPVRAVSDALGLDVEWDGNTNTVALTTPGQGDTIGEGMYLVGKDIPAGTYLLTAVQEGRSAYYARLSNASGELDAIIANDNFDTTAYITVNDGEYLELTRCTGVLQ